MALVTSTPVITNDLQTWLSLHLSSYTSVLAHYCMGISSAQDQSAKPGIKAVDKRGLTQSGTVQGQETMYLLEESGRLWKNAGTFDESLIFPMVNTFSWRGYWLQTKTRLVNFSTSCGLHLQGCSFSEEN